MKRCRECGNGVNIVPSGDYIQCTVNFVPQNPYPAGVKTRCSYSGEQCCIRFIRKDICEDCKFESPRCYFCEIYEKVGEKSAKKKRCSRS